MKITKADIIKYREMVSKNWHDQEWWDYMDTTKAESIGYAEGIKEFGDTYADIAQKAKEYLDINKK